MAFAPGPPTILTQPRLPNTFASTGKDRAEWAPGVSIPAICAHFEEYAATIGHHVSHGTLGVQP